MKFALNYSGFACLIRSIVIVSPRLIAINGGLCIGAPVYKGAKQATEIGLAAVECLRLSKESFENKQARKAAPTRKEFLKYNSVKSEKEYYNIVNMCLFSETNSSHLEIIHVNQYVDNGKRRNESIQLFLFDKDQFEKIGEAINWYLTSVNAKSDILKPQSA